MTKATGMKTDHIEYLLSKKYEDSQFFFMTQVKNGRSFNSDGLLILDGLAIAKSWSHPKMIWFEIKVSRWDFLQDNKWVHYQKYVNEFYFVCPEWLIQKEELPDNVWLMYCKEDSTRIVKKPKFMPNSPDKEMLLYIIYNRLKSVKRPEPKKYRTNIENWMEDKIRTRELGLRFKNKLVTKLEEQEQAIERLDRENKEQTHKLDIIEKALQEAWFNKKYRQNSRDYTDFINWLSRAAKRGVPDNAISLLDNIIWQTHNLKSYAESLKTYIAPPIEETQIQS